MHSKLRLSLSLASAEDLQVNGSSSSSSSSSSFSSSAGDAGGNKCPLGQSRHDKCVVLGVCDKSGLLNGEKDACRLRGACLIGTNKINGKYEENVGRGAAEWGLRVSELLSYARA